MTARVRLEDLPPAARAQVEAELARKPKRSKGSRGTTKCAMRCHACGELFSSWGQVDKHDPSHHRIEMVIDQTER